MPAQAGGQAAALAERVNARVRRTPLVPALRDGATVLRPAGEPEPLHAHRRRA